MKAQPKKVLVGAGAVLFSLLVSLALYFGTADRLVRRTLFFPETPGVEARGQVTVVSEIRPLHARPGLQPKAEQIVEELILGPARAGTLPVVPQGTKMHGVVVSRRVAYVNLSSHVLAPAEVDLPLEPERRVQAVAHALYFNFPRLRRVYVLIDGETPDWSLVKADPSLDFTDGVVDRSPLVR